MSIHVIIEDGIAEEYVVCDKCTLPRYNNTLFPAANFVPMYWKTFDEKDTKGFWVKKHLCPNCK